jgi:hypothetical protein
MNPNAAKHASPTHVFGGLIERGCVIVPEIGMEAEARDSGLGTRGSIGTF